MASSSSTSPTSSPTLTIHPATLADIPQISTIFLSSFTEPILQQMFPPTEGVKAWWDSTNSHDLLHRDCDHYLVVKASSTEEEGKVIAYAKWQCPSDDTTPSAKEFFPRFPPWPEESDKELCDRFFSWIHDVRVRFFEKKGEEQHFYLDMLATLPGYRKLGAASMLVDWGLERAQKQGKMAYVDASDMGKSVYERCGFEKLELQEVRAEGIGFDCTAYVKMPKVE